MVPVWSLGCRGAPFGAALSIGRGACPRAPGEKGNVAFFDTSKSSSSATEVNSSSNADTDAREDGGGSGACDEGGCHSARNRAEVGAGDAAIGGDEKITVRTEAERRPHFPQKGLANGGSGHAGGRHPLVAEALVEASELGEEAPSSGFPQDKQGRIVAQIEIAGRTVDIEHDLGGAAVLSRLGLCAREII